LTIAYKGIILYITLTQTPTGENNMEILKEIKVNNFLTKKAGDKVKDTVEVLASRGYLGLIDELEYFIDRESNLYQSKKFYNSGLVQEFSKNINRRCDELLSI